MELFENDAIEPITIRAPNEAGNERVAWRIGSRRGREKRD